MRRDPVTIAWAAGLGLAILAYAVGPQAFMAQLGDGFDTAMWRLGEFIASLSLAGRDAVRALAIGVYATFAVLSVMVIRRGGRGRAMLFWISLLFFALVGRAAMLEASNGRWLVALLLALFGAATMSQRMRQPPLTLR